MGQRPRFCHLYCGRLQIIKGYSVSIPGAGPPPLLISISPTLLTALISVVLYFLCVRCCAQDHLWRFHSMVLLIGCLSLLCHCIQLTEISLVSATASQTAGSQTGNRTDQKAAVVFVISRCTFEYCLSTALFPRLTPVMRHWASSFFGIA